MGIDVEIYATGDLTLNMDADWLPDLHGYDETNGGRFYRESMERYFSESYPRGNWPVIAQEIQEMRDAFPRANIFYTDDHSDPDDPGTEVTPEFLEKQWALWNALSQEERDAHG